MFPFASCEAPGVNPRVTQGGQNLSINSGCWDLISGVGTTIKLNSCTKISSVYYKHTHSSNSATIQGSNLIAATIQCPIDLNYPTGCLSAILCH
ncbi:hypothetical protein Hdeb2414_s0008g00282581 [Helianthus debilis subsp. tardiflorus]